MLYRDEPILQLPFRFLTALVDIDELLTTWRYRHALMVQRMIGARSAPAAPPATTTSGGPPRAHRMFPDLFALSTFLIPRSRLPALPATCGGSSASSRRVS